MNWSRLVMIAAASFLLGAEAPGAGQGGEVPSGVILVKGAWSSAAGSLSPLPEDGMVSQNRYDNAYFGVSYTFGADWAQHFASPPPSDGGYYVLAQIEPRDPALNVRPGHFLIAAQDLFFTTTPARSAAQFVDYYRSRLGDDYRVERAGKVKLANHEFARLDYISPASGLHWRVLATEIRCHVLEFVFTGSDARSLDRQVASLATLMLRTGNIPVCIRDFANDDTVLERENPVFGEPRFNQVPVRIVIDQEGKVKQIHFLSAFPEQAKAVADALSRWRFKPYLIDGQPVEVETGVVFGRASRSGFSPAH